MWINENENSDRDIKKKSLKSEMLEILYTKTLLVVKTPLLQKKKKNTILPPTCKNHFLRRGPNVIYINIMLFFLVE